ATDEVGLRFKPEQARARRVAKRARAPRVDAVYGLGGRIEQQLNFLLPARYLTMRRLELPDVPRDGRPADHVAALVGHRRNRDGHVDGDSVFPDVERLDLLDAFAATDGLEAAVEKARPLRRTQQAHVSTDGFARRVAV